MSWSLSISFFCIISIGPLLNPPLFIHLLTFSLPLSSIPTHSSLFSLVPLSRSSYPYSLSVLLASVSLWTLMAPGGALFLLNQRCVCVTQTCASGSGQNSYTSDETVERRGEERRGEEKGNTSRFFSTYSYRDRGSSIFHGHLWRRKRKKDKRSR